LVWRGTGHAVRRLVNLSFVEESPSPPPRRFPSGPIWVQVSTALGFSQTGSGQAPTASSLLFFSPRCRTLVSTALPRWCRLVCCLTAPTGGGFSSLNPLITSLSSAQHQVRRAFFPPHPPTSSHPQPFCSITLPICHLSPGPVEGPGPPPPPLNTRCLQTPCKFSQPYYFFCNPLWLFFPTPDATSRAAFAAGSFLDLFAGAPCLETTPLLSSSLIRESPHRCILSLNPAVDYGFCAGFLSTPPYSPWLVADSTLFRSPTFFFIFSPARVPGTGSH